MADSSTAEQKVEAEKIIDALTSKTATLDGGEADGYHLAVTIGVCNRIPSKEDSVADYMMEAHLALAEAKEHLGAGTHAVVFRS